jgi:hypothetical protein
MSDPEPDDIFRARLLRVVAEIDRFFTLLAFGPRLDNIGRKYGCYRTGVPLNGFGASKDLGFEHDA